MRIDLTGLEISTDKSRYIFNADGTVGIKEKVV